MSFVIFWIFVAFASGCAAGGVLPFSFLFLFLVAAAFLLAAVFFLRRRRRLIFDLLISAVFFLSGFIHAADERRLYTSCCNWAGERVFIVQPQEKLKEGRLFDLYRAVIKGVDTGEGKTAAVYCSLRWKDYSHSSAALFDDYRLRGRLRVLPVPFSFPSRYKLALYSRRDEKPVLLRRRGGVHKAAARASSFLARRLGRDLAPAAASFIKAVFLGKKDVGFRGLRRIFTQAGTAHILAISGLHVGIVLGVVLLMLKVLRLNYRQRIMAAVPLILFYAFICSLRPPVLRAALFYGYFAFSFYLRRRPPLFCALSFAGLADLILRPHDIFSLSFQLSFLGVLFILLGFEYFYPFASEHGIAAWGRKLFFLSLFVNLGIWPLISFYFGRVYPLNILVNIIDIPFLGVILSAVIVYFVFSFGILAKIFAGSLGLLAGVFIKLNEFFSRLPGASLSFRLPLLWVFVYYLALGAVVFIRIKYLIDLRKA